MTEVQGFSQTFVTPLLRRWWIIVLLGVAIVAIGVVLLLNLYSAARTLAILVGIGLVFAAADEIAQAERHQRRWPSYVLGAIWLVTAIFAFAWPGVTLWAIAVVVGIGFLVEGLSEVMFALYYRRELPRWGLWLLDGAFSVVIGVLALAWPNATIVALAILLGLRVLFRGLATVMFGLGLRSIYKTTQVANV